MAGVIVSSGRKLSSVHTAGALKDVHTLVAPVYERLTIPSPRVVVAWCAERIAARAPLFNPAPKGVVWPDVDGIGEEDFPNRIIVECLPRWDMLER